MSRLNALILITGLSLAILNVYALLDLSYSADRLIRLFGTGIFSIIALFTLSRRNWIGGLVFAFLMLSDFSLLNYEQETAMIFEFALRGFSYILIALQVKRSFTASKLLPLQKLMFLVIFAFNFYLLYTVADIFASEIKIPILDILFYFQGTSAIFLLFMAALYLNWRGNKLSIIYFFAGLGFMLSDLAAFAAYHLNYKDFFIVDRVFYILAVSSYLKFHAQRSKYNQEDPSSSI